MKGEIIIIIIWLNIIVTQSFAQSNITNIIINTSKELAFDLKNKEKGEEKSIKEITGNIKILKIQFSTITNSDGDQTYLSEKLSENLAIKLDYELNNSQVNMGMIGSSFPDYSVFFVTKKEDLNKELSNSKEFDFILEAQYLIDKDTLKIYNTKLIPNEKYNSDKLIILDDIFYVNNSVTELKKIDTIIKHSSVLEEFIKIEQKQNLISSFNIYSNEKNLSKKIYPFGIVYEVKYEQEYSLKVGLFEKAYIYLLFYSPQGSYKDFLFLPYPFYPEENIILNAKENILCDEYPLVFEQKYNESKNVYLKIIASRKKIILNDITEEIELSEEIITKVLDVKNTTELIKRIKKNNKDIQTKTIILKFK